MGDQHKISRARFLAAAGGAAAAGTLAHPARARSGAPERPKATAAVLGAGDAGPRSPQFLRLEPEGRSVRLHTAHGGDVVGIVVAEAPRVVGDASERFERKRIEGVRYTPIVLRYRFGRRSPELERAVSNFLDGTPSLLTGEVLDTDPRGFVISRLFFRDAAIAGVKLPALDLASKDQAHVTVRLQPESTQRDRHRGARVDAPEFGERADAEASGLKWLRSQFRLGLEGADAAAADVTTVKSQIVRATAGAHEVPNLIVTLPERSADDLFVWHERFVVRGESGPENERSGSLTYLTQVGQALREVRFRGLGIVSVAAVAPTEGGVRRVQAEMYCEEITL